MSDHAHHDDIIYPNATGFVLVHLACLGVFWTGVTTTALVLCATLYVVRMFAITAGFHRYFSHRSYKTSRVGQFLFALVAQTSAQSGVLWWAAKHREHHKHSDTEDDVHSPAQHGFVFAHVGWIFTERNQNADYSNVPDLTRYPELRWLDRHKYLPAAILATVCFLIGGWSGLVVGFFCSTVLTYHGTFAINSLAHTTGRQRYVTGDDSRNNWWLALITLGEGWHNNHHFYQASTRQGFRWWEIDITYYLLKALSWTGLVWDLQVPPEAVVRGEKEPPRPFVEKAAQRLAESFPIDAITQGLRERWEARAVLAERLAARRERAASTLADLHVPELPTLEELRARAAEMYATSPSLDDIVERAREILLESVWARLSDDVELAPATG